MLPVCYLSHQFYKTAFIAFHKGLGCCCMYVPMSKLLHIQIYYVSKKFKTVMPQ